MSTTSGCLALNRHTKLSNFVAEFMLKLQICERNKCHFKPLSFMVIFMQSYTTRPDILRFMGLTVTQWKASLTGKKTGMGGIPASQGRHGSCQGDRYRWVGQPGSAQGCRGCRGQIDKGGGAHLGSQTQGSSQSLTPRGDILLGPYYQNRQHSFNFLKMCQPRT